MSKIKIGLLLLISLTAVGGGIYSFSKEDNDSGNIRVVSLQDTDTAVSGEGDASQNALVKGEMTDAPVNLATTPLTDLEWKKVSAKNGSGRAYANGDFVIQGNSLQIASGAVTSSDILRHSIEAADIDTETVTSRTIRDGDIRSKDLNNNLIIKNLSVSGSLTLADGATSPFAATISADSLDFTDLKDALTLDASTDISVTGSDILSVTNSGTGNSFVVNDQASDTTPFMIDAAGNVGIGTTAPARKLEILEANSAPQLRLSKSGSVYTDVTVDSAGDMKLATTGGDIRAMSENLWICDNDGCPTAVTTTNPPVGQGNIVVENALMFGNSFSTKQINATTLGTYDSGGNLIMTFDEQ